MNFKKLLCVLSMMFVVGTVAHAELKLIDISAGVSGSIGLPSLRGAGVGWLDKSMVDDDISKLYFGIQLDVLFSFSENFALETGLGFSRSSFSAEWNESDLSDSSNDARGVQLFERTQLYVPLMFRASIGYGVGDFYLITYGALGLKVGFPLSDFYHIVDYDPSTTSTTDKIAENISPGAGFTMDISIAIGQEIKLGESHYVGVRFGLDVNVLSPHSGYVTQLDDYTKYSLDDDILFGPGASDIFMDNFNFSLTYRYSFASMLWG